MEEPNQVAIGNVKRRRSDMTADQWELSPEKMVKVLQRCPMPYMGSMCYTCPYYYGYDCAFVLTDAARTIEQLLAQLQGGGE